jgi:hypothetical protein
MLTLSKGLIGNARVGSTSELKLLSWGWHILHRPDAIRVNYGASGDPASQSIPTAPILPVNAAPRMGKMTYLIFAIRFRST